MITLPTRMWANAQRDGRPVEHRWCPLFNAAKFSRVPCSNAAKTRNPLKLAGQPQTPKTVSAASWPKFTILCGHVEEILLFNKFFSDCLCSSTAVAHLSCFWSLVCLFFAANDSVLTFMLRWFSPELAQLTNFSATRLHSYRCRLTRLYR